MKVAKLIEIMKEYDPEDEILVAWWDKSCADDYVSLAGDREEITKEEWARVIEEMDNSSAQDYDLNSITEVIHETVERVVPIGSEGATR